MEIKVKAEEVTEAQTAIYQLKKIPMKGVYGLTVARLQKKLDAEAATIFEARNAIFKEHGELVPLKDGETAALGSVRYNVPPEKRAELEEEIGELNKGEISIVCDPLPPGITEEVECAPEVWAGLLPFLKAEIERNKKDDD
jgi:hypothetical protein